MKSLKEMEKTITELKRSLSHFNIGEIPTPNRQDRLTRRASDNDYLMLKVAIFGAFYPNYFIRSHGSFDMKAVLRELSDKNPMTTMYLSGFPVDQTQFGDLYVNQIKELFKVWTTLKFPSDFEFFFSPTHSKIVFRKIDKMTYIYTYFLNY